MTVNAYTDIAKKSWQTNKKVFKFVDLFAGIGGFRIAAERLGGECVFSSEWDKHSQKTYYENFGDVPSGDITKIDEKTIPNHDILFSGFPCQSFSISGKQKGFDDTRGTLFFDVARIIREKNPKMFLLENVKNFAKHDEGRTLQIILDTLDELEYKVYCKVLRSSDYGIPQARERIYIVGFKKSLNIKNFEYPEPVAEEELKVVKDIIDEDTPVDAKIIEREIIFTNNLQKDKRKPNRIGYFNKGGQGERVYSVNSAGITLSAYGGGAAGKTGAYMINGVMRKLSPRECARMQGFPEDFVIPVSTNLALKQFGDSVSSPLVNKIIEKMLQAIGGVE